MELHHFDALGSFTREIENVAVVQPTITQKSAAAKDIFSRIEIR